MSKIEVDAIEPQSGTTLTLGASGDTITIPSGATLSSIDPLVFPAGSAASPAITTTGDTNTGIFFPAADTIGFAEGGAEAMRIDSSGRLGIGTTNPTVKLQTTIASSGVSGIASSGVALFENSGNSDVVIGAGTSSKSRIAFADSGDWIIGRIDYDHSDNSMRFGTAGIAERMRITSAGDFLVGKTATSVTTAGDELRADGEAVFVRAGGHCLRLQRLTSEGNVAVFYNNVGINTGSISVGGSATAYNTSSDYRLKENVSYDFDATTRLKQLKPARFNFIADADTTVDGFLAHEVQDVVPEAISGEKDAMITEEYEITPAVLDENGNVITEAVMGTREVPDYQGIDQSKLVPILTKALQEAVTKIETLEARITALETNNP